jgi:hypothetical protein
MMTEKRIIRDPLVLYGRSALCPCDAAFRRRYSCRCDVFVVGLRGAWPAM